MSPGGTQTWTAQSGDEHTYHEAMAPPRHPPTVYSVPVLRGYWPLELSVMEQRWETHTEKNNLLLIHGLLADTKFIFQC